MLHTHPEHRPVAATYLLCLTLIGLAACNNTPPAAQQPTPPRPALVIPASSHGQAAPGFIAEVRAVTRAELSFAVSGRVASLHANVGDSVRAGQLLATLDSTPLRAQQQAGASDEQAARARLQEIRQRHARTLAAQQAQAISAGELEALQAELSAAEAALQAASAQRQQADWALNQASLRAPVDGVIGSRQVTLGQAATPGAAAFSIEGSGRELAVWLPASSRISVGQTLTLQHDGQLHSGQVLRVGGTLAAGGQRQVFINAPALAAPGDTWQVQLPTRDKAVAEVPLRALLPGQSASTAHVLRLAQDGKTVEKVAVQLGEVQDDRVAIRAGLQASDLIIVAGAAGITPGSRVQAIAYRDGGQP